MTELEEIEEGQPQTIASSTYTRSVLENKNHVNASFSFSDLHQGKNVEVWYEYQCNGYLVGIID